MKVFFFEPPAEQRIGGLDAAIRALEESLCAQGAHVEINPGEIPRSGSATIAHFHGAWQPTHPAIARRCAKARIPVVVSPHGMLEPWALRHKAWKKWPYFLLRERAHLLAADVVLATAPTEAARLASLLGRRPIDTLPLGLTGNARPDYAAARSELGWRDDERVLLYLSRIHPKKGLHMLLEALALVRNVGNVRVVIVGGGAPDYVERVRSLGDSLLGRVRAVDWVGEVWGVSRWRYFQGADLFCLTTHSENFGLAVLEALQVGTPVLTTTGTPWGGWLAAPRGYITEPVTGAIADGLRAWLAAPEWSDSDRAALGEWAVDEFHWKHLGQRYAALYQRLLP